MTKEERFNLRLKKERAEKGFTTLDAIDINLWFMNIMPRMLKVFRRSITDEGGIPLMFLDEFYELNKDRINMSKDDFLYYNHSIDEELRLEAKEYAHSKWFSELDKMIFLFKEANKNLCHIEDKYEHGKKCQKEALEMFVKYFDDLNW